MTVQTKGAKQLDISWIVMPIMAHYGVTLAQLQSKSRKEQLVLARHWVMYMVRKIYPEVGTVGLGVLLGKRDHATVTHGCKRIRREMDVYKQRRDEYYEFQSKIGVVISEHKIKKDEFSCT